ncbi:hypothetical protein HDV05_004453 [Chytridiales sp. JEL 0842]|nr:hypothetical protein HDV05_004453 [Chytridiales sp. JEL 0842]
MLANNSKVTAALSDLLETISVESTPTHFSALQESVRKVQEAVEAQTGVLRELKECMVAMSKERAEDAELVREQMERIGVDVGVIAREQVLVSALNKISSYIISFEYCIPLSAEARQYTSQSCQRTANVQLLRDIVYAFLRGDGFH